MRTGARRELLGRCDVHDHIMWVFDRDEEWTTAATAFLEDGLAHHERLYYGAARPLGELPADLAGLEGRDALLASTALQVLDSRVIARASDAEREALIRATVDQALALGFTGARLAVDSSETAPGGDWDAQAGWERRSDRLCTTLALTALCGVNRAELDDEALTGVACLHPEVGGVAPPRPFCLFATGDGLALAGEVDAPSCEALARALAREETGPGDFIIDLSRVRFVDGRGMATIVAVGDRLAAAGGTLVVTGASPMARRIWELCAFDHHPGARMATEEPM
jgi:anti-anti-sigma factor